jgi:hypothetical protein
MSRNPHSHPPPSPVKTPPPLIKCFKSLLLRLEWKLADATPRRIVLDSGFMEGLRQVLGWHVLDHDPMLQDLHPSLGNLDHVRRLIDVLRTERFPHGTEFNGLLRYHFYLFIYLYKSLPRCELLAVEQASLPVDQCYLRCVERHVIPGEDEFRLIICMTSWMSSHLLHSKRLSIDTSFKRVRGWQEFEIEAWDDDHMRCKFVSLSHALIYDKSNSRCICSCIHNVTVIEGTPYLVSPYLRHRNARYTLTSRLLPYSWLRHRGSCCRWTSRPSTRYFCYNPVVSLWLKALHRSRTVLC